MRRKLRLDVDTLSVSSFETRPAPLDARGTVEGREEPCTCGDSCACPTAAYYCAPIAWTFYSCDFTRNQSCTVQPSAESCVSGEFTCSFDLPC